MVHVLAFVEGLGATEADHLLVEVLAAMESPRHQNRILQCLEMGLVLQSRDQYPRRQMH